MKLDLRTEITAPVPRAITSIADSDQYHLLHYPSDSSQPDTRTRLLFTCDAVEDLPFVREFCKRYARHFSCSIVEPFCAAKANHISYVRWLTAQNLAVNTVVIVLVGPTTSRCANVDWDIAAALTDVGEGTAGLVGIILPHYFDMAEQIRNLRMLPRRLVDNTSNGYASIYTWQHQMNSLYNVQNMVETALASNRMSIVQANNKLALMRPNSGKG